LTLLIMNAQIRSRWGPGQAGFGAEVCRLVFTGIKRHRPFLRLHQLWLLNGVRAKYCIKSGHVNDLLILGSGKTIQRYSDVEFLPSNIPY